MTRLYGRVLYSQILLMMQAKILSDTCFIAYLVFYVKLLYSFQYQILLIENMSKIQNQCLGSVDI
ncbi:hypothetical protein GCM10023206_25270 [Acinetobacter puyangensis]